MPAPDGDTQLTLGLREPGEPFNMVARRCQWIDGDVKLGTAIQCSSARAPRNNKPCPYCAVHAAQAYQAGTAFDAKPDWITGQASEIASAQAREPDAPVQKAAEGELS